MAKADQLKKYEIKIQFKMELTNKNSLYFIID